jgi:hypothetical protein
MINFMEFKKIDGSPYVMGDEALAQITSDIANRSISDLLRQKKRAAHLYMNRPSFGWRGKCFRGIIKH